MTVSSGITVTCENDCLESPSLLDLFCFIETVTKQSLYSVKRLNEIRKHLLRIERYEFVIPLSSISNKSEIRVLAWRFSSLFCKKL